MAEKIKVAPTPPPKPGIVKPDTSERAKQIAMGQPKTDA